VGHWNFNLDNTAGRYNGTFSPNLVVDILDDGVRIMKGYLDLPKPLGKETPETKFEEIMAVSGRDFGQDLDNLILDKVYPIQHADDIIADILATVSSEITYTSPGTAPQLTAEGKDDYLITLISGILSQINYDAFVDENKALQLFAQGVDSGITLKMVEDASDNNIVGDIQFDEADGLEIRNYIKVKGKLIEDGITEGNANGWNGKPGNVVSNDLADFVYGGASIKCEKGSASECYLKLICPKYNYNSWALTTGNLALSFRTRYNTNPAQFYPISIYLVDSSGNSIFHSSAMTGIADGWNKTSAALGPDVEIGTGKPWAYNVGSTFDWNHVVELWVLTHSNVDTLKIDGLCMPVRMYAFSQDAPSQGLYRVRMIPLERQDIESQVELQAYADDYKAKRKDPMAAIRLTAKAEAGLLGDPKVNKWIPGYKLLVNAPPAGINNVEYMMVDTTYRLSRDAGQGWTRLVDLYLVKNTVKVDKIRWLLAHDPEFAISYLMREKLKFLQRMEQTLATGWMEPPKPLGGEHIRDGSLYEGKFGFSPYGNNLVPNPGFEQDSDGDAIPDKWTWGQQNGAGGSRAYISDAFEGSQAVKTTLLAGNVLIQTASWYSDFIPILSGVKYFVALPIKGTGGNAAARIVWYAADKTYLSWTDAWNGAPTGAYDRHTGQVISPANAFYARFECYFGNTSASTVECQFDLATLKEILFDSQEIGVIIKNIHLAELINASNVKLTSLSNLADWQRSEDGTYFDGAKVYMNSIAAAKLGGTIGVRGVPHALDKRAGETYSNPSLAGWGTWVCPVEIIYAGKSDARHRLHQVSADVKKYLSDPGTDTAQAYIRVRCSQNGADYTVVYGPEEFTNTSYEEYLCTLSSDYVSASGSPLYIRIEVNIYRDSGDIGITQAWIKDPRINDRYQDGYRLELT
jgi:hypothetical protein